jgi:hypothetical protein
MEKTEQDYGCTSHGVLATIHQVKTMMEVSDNTSIVMKLPYCKTDNGFVNVTNNVEENPIGFSFSFSFLFFFFFLSVKS